MAKYLSIEDARKDGFVFDHIAKENRFTLTKDQEEFGTVRYRLTGDKEIDFNSTLVDPSLRGTGLAAILTKLAVGDDIVKGRLVKASCWYVDGFLTKNPEFLAEGASF